MGLRDFALFEVLQRNAQLYPHRTAFIFDDTRISHADYLARVERLASGLVGAGVRAGDRVVILSQNNLEFVDFYGAVARLGAILVPINWRLGADEIAYIAADAAPKIVIADANLQKLLYGRQAALPTVERWYGIGGGDESYAPFATLLAGANASPLPEQHASAEAGFVMFYTAAVGGRPRGALLSQAGIMANSVQLLCSWELTERDVNWGVLPLFHLTGLVMLAAAQLAGGATVVVPKFDAATALQSIGAGRATMLAEFPPILGALLDAAEGAADGLAGLASLRTVTGLDSAETIARFERLCPQACFWTIFGQSETSGFVTLGRFRDRPGAAGRPGFLNAVAVLDDADRPVAVGEVGEIAVRGPAVFKGYWNCEADTGFTFRNGWHHTGDLGAFDADGFLWYKGRSPAKELIKPGGENVYPAEVEGAIAAHPAIAEVVVFGVPDPQWGEAIKAVCALKPGERTTADAIADFVGGRIARYKRPKYVTFVAALPRTAADTIDRGRVKVEYGRPD
jgi:acyl-CoA synthetase (AMP-forming)/AMP-acid ligase II